MCKKGLIVLLSAMSCFVTSCVDKNYDLANKEISTDVKLEGNTIALPVGSLKPVLLDSLIDVNEIELLVKDANGVYAIKMEDSIAVNEEIEAIALDIAPFVYSYHVKDFGKVDINNVNIGGKSISSGVGPLNISVADLNTHLPHLSDAFKTSIGDKDLESALGQLDRMPGGELSYTLSGISVKTDEKTVDCTVEYKLPKEIETIKSIKLGSDADKNGTLVKVNVASPRVLENCTKTLEITVEFPDNFHLAKNTAVDGNYTIDGGEVTLTGFVAQGDNTEFCFYITEITDVDKYIKNGVISLKESINYSIKYDVDGEVVLKKGMTMDDFAFDVNFDVELAFQNVAGKTKDVKVDFAGLEMDLSSKLTDLKNISMVNYVEFDEESSFIQFKTTMDENWFGAFELMEGYALKVSIPKELVINHELSEITGKDNDVVYNKAENAYYVTDLSILSNSDWKIAIQKIDLNLSVEDGKCELKKSAKIELVNLDNPSENGHFYFKGREMESMVEILEKFNNAKDEVLFELLESELVIKNAVVKTTATTSSLKPEKPFKITINEKIADEIERIERIGFEEDVLITMALDVEGLDGVESVMNFDFEMSLPSFLKLESYDEASGVKIENGLLHVETEYNSSSTEPLQLKLLCTGLDFVNEEFGQNGYVPQRGDDGNKYIKYSSDVFVDGTVEVQSTEFHSTMLKNDVSFNIEFDIDEFVVESFHGLYCAEIEGVDEKIDFDLGEDLDFLKDASLTLADPQLELVLTNTVGVPVDVVLDIFGRNENGDVIESTRIGTTLTINPAEYDVDKDILIPVETRYLLTTTECYKEGYTNVKIENLGSLLAEMPNSLSLKVNPVIQTGVTHHVDVSQPIKLDAAYSVVIPFKFTELNFCYNDTITGLGSDLGETMEMFSNVSLSIKMDVINTIPIGLSLDITPLDVNGNEIKDIEIDELNVAVGSGEDLVDEDGNVCATVEPQKFVFGIKSKKGDISSLDGLAFLLTAAADHTDGAAIKGEQGLKISNIVFEVSGDVEVDFGK